MKITLKIWRQPSSNEPGRFITYHVADAKPEMTIPELLDRLNDTLVTQGQEPVAFESDCREGICGTCGITVDGRPHGPQANTTTCKQHLRSFSDGQTVIPGCASRRGRGRRDGRMGAVRTASTDRGVPGCDLPGRGRRRAGG